MTIEEAIKILDPETRQEALSPYLDRPMGEMLDAMIEASRMGASALRTRPAKLDWSWWEGCDMCATQWTKADWAHGGAHDFRIDGDILYYFDAQFGWDGIQIKCGPVCGRPLTEEAWVELERRIGGNDGTTD